MKTGEGGQDNPRKEFRNNRNYKILNSDSERGIGEERGALYSGPRWSEIVDPEDLLDIDQD